MMIMLVVGVHVFANELKDNYFTMWQTGARHTIDVKDSKYKLAGKLANRALKDWPIHRTDLDRTSLAKPGNLLSLHSPVRPAASLSPVKKQLPCPCASSQYTRVWS